MKKLIGGQDSLFPWVLHPVHLYEYGLELGLSAEELLHGAGLSLQDIDDVQAGVLVMGERLVAGAVPSEGSVSWLAEFGWPTVLGMGMFAVGGAALGYVGVKLIWRLRIWLKRRVRR
jgi:hypothetical protein